LTDTITSAAPIAETPARPIRMIAMDLDGTILENGELIRPEVIAALRTITERGVFCVTATGRQIAFQRELFRQYEMDVTTTGIMRALIGDEREVYLAEDGDYVPLLPWNEHIRELWAVRFPLAWDLLLEAQAEAESRGWTADVMQPAEIAEARGLPTLVLGEASEGAELCRWIQEQIEARGLPLQTNRNIRLVQVFDAAVGKGHALAQLADALGVPHDQVLAVGDSANDYTMLDGRLGYGFRTATLHNAEDELKEIVRAGGGYVATREAGLGTVEAIERLILGVA